MKPAFFTLLTTMICLVVFLYYLWLDWKVALCLAPFSLALLWVAEAPTRLGAAESARPPPSSPQKVQDARSFRNFCAKCHGVDGSGSPGRKFFPQIPDYTNPAWQKGRSDTAVTGEHSRW